MISVLSCSSVTGRTAPLSAWSIMCTLKSGGRNEPAVTEPPGLALSRPMELALYFRCRVKISILKIVCGGEGWGNDVRGNL